MNLKKLNLKNFNLKKLDLKKIKLIAIIGLFLISFISNFAYQLFPNIIFSFFFPVNESIWEHMKILFTSTLLYGIIDYILLKKNKVSYNNFPFQLYFTAISSIPIYLVIFIPLYKLFGENMFISLTLMFLVYAFEEFISYHILKDKEYKILNLLAVPIIIASYIGFIYLTYNPPHTYIFYDIKDEKYGIDKYQKI